MAWFKSSMPSLTIMVIWLLWMCSLPQSSTKHCLIEAVVCCDTFLSVVDPRWHYNPLYKCSSRISQWDVSRLNPQLKNSESAVSAQYRLQPFRLLFLSGCAKSGFSRKNLTQSTSWCNRWEVSPKGNSQQIIIRVNKCPQARDALPGCRRWQFSAPVVVPLCFQTNIC